MNCSRFLVILTLLLVNSLSAAVVQSQKGWIQEPPSRSLQIESGILAMTIALSDSGLLTESLTINGGDILEKESAGIAFRLSFASPNRCPAGIQPENAPDYITHEQRQKTLCELDEQTRQFIGDTGVVFIDPIDIDGKAMSRFFDLPTSSCIQSSAGNLYTLRFRSVERAPLQACAIELFFQTYRDCPVIRKWFALTNNSGRWLRLNSLIISDLVISETFRNRILLTPAEQGASSCLIAFGSADQDSGVILGSEIPSAMRMIKDSGEMGYADEHFEWIVGPGERFVSEPVFYFAWAGKNQKTISAPSLSLDRTVEGPLQEFLQNVLQIGTKDRPIYAPLWCSWSNFGQNVNDEIIREMADRAAKAGMRTLQIDMGWQRGSLGTEPDTNKFANFVMTSHTLRDLGLKLGLWVSVFRDKESKDMHLFPNLVSCPLLRRKGPYEDGYAMSLASPWKYFYVQDLVFLHDFYGAVYFKQDFTNIKYGDFAAGHESRSLKESRLRGLRGLLESQLLLRAGAADVVNEITHEIYWGTPGVPADLAALKAVCLFHIPPNDYSGLGKHAWPNRVADYEHLENKELIEKELLQGCWNARQRFFAHRGLPLHCIEYYSASTVSIQQSLTRAIQDRQVCSWLMGAPYTFAGDLASLSADQLEHYRKRFELLRYLQESYDIYRHFQFSGVPRPTDSGWHWWGKLNEQGYGAVVVLRGSEGENHRRINIPWVKENQHYRVIPHLTGQKVKVLRGTELINGALDLELPLFGQEILELAPVEKQLNQVGI